MPILKMPASLRPYLNGLTEIPISGTNVGEAVESLLVQFPAMRPHLTDREGNLRPFVNFYIAEQNVRDLQGLNTPLESKDVLNLVPSIAGG